MDFSENKIEELKNKAMELDLPDSLENDLRMFITELYIKRDQVSQLRSDYAYLEAENKELKGNLEKANKNLEENHFNLSILSKKVHGLEQELTEKRHTLLQLNLQHKMTTTEVTSLKDILQKSEVERAELSKKVHLFEAELKHHKAYNNEFPKRENNLRVFIDEMSEIMKSLKEEQSQIIELFKSIDLAQGALLELEKLKKKMKALLEKRTNWRKLMLRHKVAKLDKLEELMQTFESEEHIDTTNIIFVQWRLNRDHYRQQLKDTHETISNLIESYNNEKHTNLKLIETNEELASEVVQLNKDKEELNAKINELCGQISGPENIVQIKEEPILIFD